MAFHNDLINNFSVQPPAQLRHDANKSNRGRWGCGGPIGSAFNGIGLMHFKIFPVMRFGSSKRKSMGLDMILATYGWVKSTNMNNIAQGGYNHALIIACKD